MSVSSQQRASASITVEAALVLPLFLFFFLNLSSAIEMIRLHGNLELALWSVGNQLSVYGCALEDGSRSAQLEDRTGGAESAQSEGERSGSAWQQLSGVAFSYTYVKAYIRSYLGADYLESSPLLGGVNGLQFLESQIFTEEDTFEIVVAYGVRPFHKIAGFRPFGMVNHYYGHLWNGYKIPDKEAVDLVYVTENGVVYHENINCTHLRLSVREVRLEQALDARNSGGGKYKVCEICGKGRLRYEPEREGLNERVWITSEGDRIHFDQNCSGLKRTVHAIERAEAGAYRPCSRCAR